jgi:predicted CopG family antitoxin
METSKDTGSKRCTVLLREDTYRRLKNKGIFGESFSDVVARILDEVEAFEAK